MKTGPQPSSRFKKTELGVVLAALALVIIIVVSIWATNRHNNQNGGLPAGSVQMDTYTNSQYGFAFKYPHSWGQPQFKTAKTQAGNAYSVIFPDQTKASKILASAIVYFDSSNTVATKDAIQTQINQAKNNSAILTDSTSYAVVSNSSKLALSTLDLYQIVSLPKLNVTGAAIYYQITKAATDCPANKLSSNANCVSQSDYSLMDQIAKSIHSI